MQPRPRRYHKIAGATDSGIRRALLYFAGWGFPADTLDVSVPGYDTYILWDYATAPEETVDPDILVGSYDEVVVVAWSFGVRAAAPWLASTHARVTRTIAVNGTETHVDDLCGIPQAIFDGTLRGLSGQTFYKFMQRACGSSASSREYFNSIKPLIKGADTEHLRNELEMFGRIGPYESHNLWSLALIGSADRIFPPENQRRAWEGKTETRVIEGGDHYLPFSEIRRHIVDKQLVSKRFSNAAATYRSNSGVQLFTSDRLNELLSQTRINPDPTVIEIGAGNSPLFGADSAPAHYRRLEIWDIAATDRSRFPADAHLLQTDAEIHIAEIADRSVDLVVSASTIQWFNSPERFVATMATKLTPGGVAALAFYRPGTLGELAGITGITLRYPRLDRLGAVAREAGLEIVAAQCDDLRLEFDSAAEALRHLRLTGVNAVETDAHARAAALKFMRHVPESPDGKVTLTYRPAWLVARKPM